ncbi:hypothetical protein HYV72_01440 [Candidatus Uhrbacteria bacterium]|nr:hypothetical protein [Candidatus Uhrbacteria bacterium]
MNIITVEARKKYGRAHVIQRTVILEALDKNSELGSATVREPNISS